MATKVKITVSKGPQGVAGPQGFQGSQGPSAYEVWLSEGNSGTVQDYLDSLVGGQGIQGETGVVADLNSVPDVDTTGGVTGQVLTQQSDGSFALENVAQSLFDLTDTEEAGGIAANSTLTYIGGKWKNTAPASPPPAPTLENLTDTVLTTPADGQFLKYNGTEWINAQVDLPWTATGSDIYYNTGDVGIGTATPAAKLDVEGNVRFLLGSQSPTYALNITGVGSNTHSIGGGNSLTLGYALVNHTGSMNLASGSANKYISIGGSVSGSGSRLYVKGSTSDDTAKAFNVFDSSSSELFVVRNDGNVGIGTATPNQPLAVTGNIQASGNLIFGGTNEFALSVKSVSNQGIHIGQSTGTGLANAGVVIGTNAGRFNSGQYNTAVGPNAGYRGSYSARQTSVGRDANSGSAAYTKTNSVGVGVTSNYNGSDNTTSVGAYTGSNSPSSYTNSAFFGYGAGQSGGNNSVFVGYQAGKSDGVQLVSDTVAVGYQALTALTTGIGNTAVGYQAGAALTTGANNTFLGYGVGLAATDRSNNVLIGKDVAPSSTTINNTIAIGNSVLYSATTANAGNSVFIGHEVGKNITTASASNNVYIGYQAGLSRNGQYENVAIGTSAGTGGSSKVAIGRNSMNIGGSSSLGIGHGVGANNSGADAVIIGNAAGQYGATTESVLVGNWIARYAGGNYSVMMGHKASQDGSSHNSVHIGHSSGRENDGDSNVAVGYQTISETTTGSTISNSVALGYQALKGTTTSTAAGVVAVGYQALTALTTGAGNTAVGYQAGDSVTESSYNTVVGYQAGQSQSTHSTSVTALGYQAGYTTTLGGIFIGKQAGYSVNNSANIFIGDGAGQFVTSGSSNVGIGGGALRSTGSGAGSVALGSTAGRYTTAGGNTLLGHQSGRGVSGSNFSNTVAVGYQALTALTTGASNTAVGYQAGAAITTGGSNVLIGYQAGSALTTEANKLYIENSNSTTPLIYGEFDNDLVRINGDLEVTGGVKIEKTSNTDYDYRGDVVYFGATTSMTQGNLYYFNSSGNWAQSDANTVASSGSVLLALSLGTASDTDGMLLRGTFTMEATAIDGTEVTGDELYVGTTAGHVTSDVAAYTTGDVVRVVGYCLDGTNGQIWFNPSNDFITLA